MTIRETDSADRSKNVLLLKMERALAQRKGALIKNLQQLADAYRIGKFSERAPLKNVLAVATDAGATPEEVVNFIRYQLGRSKDNAIWLSRSGKRLFADALVSELEALSGTAEEIARASERSEDPGLNSDVHLRLIQMYLGYLGRYHTYLKWAESPERRQGGAN